MLLSGILMKRALQSSSQDGAEVLHSCLIQLLKVKKSNIASRLETEKERGMFWPAIVR